MNGALTSSEVNSLGSQVFIEFLANGNGVGKGFSASIKFGKIKAIIEEVATEKF